MNISTLGSSSTYATTSTTSTSAATQGNCEPGAVGAEGDRAHTSGPGALMGKLQKLKDSDPAKFKQVMTSIAEQLKSAAESATGDDKDRLTKLADKFSSAAASGALSGLQPPGHQHGGGMDAPPPPGAGAYQKEHHHGHHAPSAAMKSAFDQILSTVDDALNGAASTATGADGSDAAATASA